MDHADAASEAAEAESDAHELASGEAVIEAEPREAPHPNPASDAGIPGGLPQGERGPEAAEAGGSPHDNRPSDAAGTPHPNPLPQGEREQEAEDKDDAQAATEPLAGSDGPPAPSDQDLPARIEALLFVSDAPVSESALGRALGATPARLSRALDVLAEGLRGEGRGVRVQRGPDGVQLVTAPEAAAYIEHFLGLEASRRLSTAALETLAIIAYRQPVTRGTIEAIRGVGSDAAVATLRARGLITDGGRAEGPGRPTLWVTTQRFLQHFGLERPDDLPPLPEDIELPPEEAGAQLALEGGAVLDQAAAPPPSSPAPAEGPAPATPEVEIAGDLAALSSAAESALRAAAEQGELRIEPAAGSPHPSPSSDAGIPGGPPQGGRGQEG